MSALAQQSIADLYPGSLFLMSIPISSPDLSNTPTGC
jgi:hypothetical protein